MVKFTPLTRADRQIALLLFAVALAIYLRMAAPDLLAGDAGEFQFAAWRWGLAHPTGYPLYLLLGGVWQRIWALVGMGPARALNMLSAFAAAGAVSAFYLLVRGWLLSPLLISRVAALLAAFFLMLNPTFWSQSLIAEVYTAQVLLLVLLLLVAHQVEVTVAPTGEARRGWIMLLWLLTGVNLAHHAMTLLLMPGLILFLFLVDRSWWRSVVTVGGSLLAVATPLLLYLYLPLRSGPTASPWYHQRLGDGVLTLYDGSRQAFWDYVTGASISVGFHDFGQALAQIPQAILLWRLHFEWPGLALVLLGLGVLIWQRRWHVLALTLPFVILLQVFNLFYAIGDILVYYIPLYVMALLWLAFGAEQIGAGFAVAMNAVDQEAREVRARKAAAAAALEQSEDGTLGDHMLDDGVSEGAVEAGSLAQDVSAPADHPDSGGADPLPVDNYASTYGLGLLIMLLLFFLPIRFFTDFSTTLDQSQVRTPRTSWEAILAAGPPADAILVSNDRNEMVPLFYLQVVEERGQGMTGLFPLIAPDARFENLGRTIDTALADGAGQPVYLIKPMSGLAVKYQLEDANPPLVRVVGPRDATPGIPLARALGPLALVGLDWDETEPPANGAETIRLRLYWDVITPLPVDATTTVQLFDAAGEKIAQHDSPPGGLYYPTSMWQPGDRLVEEHVVTRPAGSVPVSLLIGMYSGPDFAPVAAPIEVEVEQLFSMAQLDSP